ncbi:MAG: MBL fold metallo-hydrolase [Dehalococcoidales bacterium]|nr:MBL fold metallo-hydrolase [Dehalococcoidales bacterium]
MELIQAITPCVKLLYTYTPIPAYEKYIGTYLYHGKKNALIDPGPKTAVPGLVSSVEAAGLSLEQIDYIILTHIHIDHGGATGTLLKHLPHASVVVHPRGVKHLIDPAALTKGSIDTLGELVAKYGEIESIPAARIIASEDGMRLPGTDLEIIWTPGHAAHHQCIIARNEKVLFSGDAAGILHGGLLRLTTPPPFRLKETLESLDKLIALAPSIICYGHLGGYDNAVVRLQTFRTLLLHWYEAAQSRVKQGMTFTQALDAFIETEPDLKAYFAALDKDTRKRDYAQLTNSVTGLMTAAG